MIHARTNIRCLMRHNIDCNITHKYLYVRIPLGCRQAGNIVPPRFVTGASTTQSMPATYQGPLEDWRGKWGSFSDQLMNMGECRALDKRISEWTNGETETVAVVVISRLLFPVRWQPSFLLLLALPAASYSLIGLFRSFLRISIPGRGGIWGWHGRTRQR